MWFLYVCTFVGSFYIFNRLSQPKEDFFRKSAKLRAEVYGESKALLALVQRVSHRWWRPPVAIVFAGGRFLWDMMAFSWGVWQLINAVAEKVATVIEEAFLTRGYRMLGNVSYALVWGVHMFSIRVPAFLLVFAMVTELLSTPMVWLALGLEMIGFSVAISLVIWGVGATVGIAQKLSAWWQERRRISYGFRDADSSGRGTAAHFPSYDARQDEVYSQGLQPGSEEKRALTWRRQQERGDSAARRECFRGNECSSSFGSRVSYNQ